MLTQYEFNLTAEHIQKFVSNETIEITDYPLDLEPISGVIYKDEMDNMNNDELIIKCILGSVHLERIDCEPGLYKTIIYDTVLVSDMGNYLDVLIYYKVVDV